MYADMPRKPKAGKIHPTDLWIAPRYSLKGPRVESAWENRLVEPPSTNRFLELADIALGFKNPERRKSKAAAAGALTSSY
jgi:hypothetical protein